MPQHTQGSNPRAKPESKRRQPQAGSSPSYSHVRALAWTDYFSNAFVPVLYVSGLSPLIFLWLYVHLAIAPGAGHSGWEDHFQVRERCSPLANE